MTVTVFLSVFTGQTCTDGFPYLSRWVGGSRNSDLEMTRIIPSMKITCNGTVTSWTAAASARLNSEYSKLKIFREFGGVYHFVGEFELGRCAGQTIVHSTWGLYECELPEQDRLLVQKNDFIGIYLPRASQSSFNVHFTTTTTDHTNYIFTEDVTFTVSPSNGAMARNTPQVNLGIGTFQGNDNIIKNVSSPPPQVVTHGYLQPSTLSSIPINGGSLILLETTLSSRVPPDSTLSIVSSPVVVEPNVTHSHSQALPTKVREQRLLLITSSNLGGLFLHSSSTIASPNLTVLSGKIIYVN